MVSLLLLMAAFWFCYFFLILWIHFFVYILLFVYKIACYFFNTFNSLLSFHFSYFFFDFSVFSFCIQKLLISYLCFGFFSNFYCCFTLFACCYVLLVLFIFFIFVSFVVPSVCYAISAHILLSFCSILLRFLIALHVTQFYRNIILLFKVFFFFVFESSFYITPYCFSLFFYVFLLISFP